MDNDKDKDSKQTSESGSKKRKRVKVDPEYQWESLSHKPIHMNDRNVNQNIEDKHGISHKRERTGSGRDMLIFMLSMIGAVAFILFCTYIGLKIKGDRTGSSIETTAAETSMPGTTESAVESITDTRESITETSVAESVAPGEDIDALDVIGGNGELVGFSFPREYRKEWLLMQREFARALDAAGYEADFKYAVSVSAGAAGTDTSLDDVVEQQIEDIKALQAEGASIIFVAPADVTSEALGQTLDSVKNSGTYVVALDHVPMHTNGVNYLFGCDDYSVGETLGWYLIDALDLTNATAEEPKCVEIFTGDMTDESLFFMYPGLMEMLFPYIDTGALVVGSGQFELEQVSTMDSSKTEAYERMQSLLANVYTQRNLDAVICTNDVLASGVSEAIEAAIRSGTYTGTVPVITGDGCEDAALDRILQGKQSMSVFHDPLQYAYRGTELVDAICHGTEPYITNTEMYQNGNFVVPLSGIEPVVITADNYDDVIVDRGYMQTAVLVD